MVSPSKKKRRRHDRLSDLQDDILGHVLSFLPAEEAGRAAVLSRRWRRALEFVQTISFQPLVTIDLDDENRRLVDRVTNALVARSRCCGGMPLLCFRVAMHRYTPSDSYALDTWLSYAGSHGVQELRLETARYGHAYTGSCRVDGSYDEESSSDSSDDLDGTDGYDNLDGYNDYNGNDGYSSWDSDGYNDLDGNHVYNDLDGNHGHSGSDTHTPTQYDVPAYARIQYDVSPELFCCATLRALHLVSCSLPPRQLPSTIHLPSLETLSLTNIMDTSRQISGENMQRVISCCPRLADLTVEACDQMTDITVKRLTRFALRCCHSIRRVTIDDAAETLRAFKYRGDASSRFTLVGHAAPTRIASAKIQICSFGNKKKKMDFEGLRGLLLLLVNATHLHLDWPDVSDKALWTEEYDDIHALHFPRFHNLTRLELGSHCTDPRVGDRVAGVLRQTPNLTALVMELQSWGQNYGDLDVPKVAVPCLRERVKEMRVEQYDEGVKLQKQLLKWLLRGALVAESVRVVLKRGRYTNLNEIKSWAPNPTTRFTFS